MCLVLLWLSAHDDVDLLLAGNRDEFYRRPSAPPAVIGHDPEIYAGRDLEAGGTWMGRNSAGLFAAITNRHGSHRSAPPPHARSRGEIVSGVLAHRDAVAARDWVAALPLAQYRAFNLLFGAAGRFWFLSSHDGGAPEEVPPGFHALSNSTLDDRSWPKVARAHRFAEAHRDLPGERLLTDLMHFLADSTPPDAERPASLEEEIHGALGAVLVNTPEYGTVSSTIITAGRALNERYYFAEGEALRNGEQPEQVFRLMDFGG